jgi:DNA photolyase
MNASTSSGSSSPKQGVAIYWYRNALRFHDNPSLLGACKSSKTLLPLYIIDPEEPFSQTPGIAAGCIRANFVLESIQEVDRKLKDQYHSQLFVVLGKPQVVLPRIIEALQVSELYFEREPALPIRESDERVLEEIRKGNAKSGCSTTINGYHTHTIHPMELYLAKCKGNVAPSSYGGFTKIFQSFPRLKVEVKDVSDVPPLPHKATETLQSLFGESVARVPSLKDLGYDTALLQNRAKGGIDFPGGEDFALQLLEKQMSRSLWVSTFEKPNTSPNALTVDTTGLSPCTFVHCKSFFTWDMTRLALAHHSLFWQMSNTAACLRVASSMPSVRYTANSMKRMCRNHPFLCMDNSCGASTTI